MLQNGMPTELAQGKASAQTLLLSVVRELVDSSAISLTPFRGQLLDALLALEQTQVDFLSEVVMPALARVCGDADGNVAACAQIAQESARLLGIFVLSHRLHTMPPMPQGAVGAPAAGDPHLQERTAVQN